MDEMKTVWADVSLQGNGWEAEYSCPECSANYKLYSASECGELVTCDHCGEIFDVRTFQNEKGET